MAWIWDAAILLVVLLAGFIGYRRGFFKSVMRLVSGVLALLLAVWLATPVASGIFDLFLQNRITDALEAEVRATVETGENTIGETLDAFLEGMPESLQALLTKNGFSGTAIQERLQLSESTDTREIAQSAVQEVIRPASISLLKLLCFFLLFVVLLILLSILTRILNKVLKLPLLKQINGALGAVIGVLEGVLLAVVLCTVLGSRAKMEGEDGWLIQEETLGQTRLVQYLDQSDSIQEWSEKI